MIVSDTKSDRRKVVRKNDNPKGNRDDYSYNLFLHDC